MFLIQQTALDDLSVLMTTSPHDDDENAHLSIFITLSYLSCKYSSMTLKALSIQYKTTPFLC